MLQTRVLAPLLLGLVTLTASACAEDQRQDKVLYEKKSQYNEIVVTEDARGLRTLWFEKGGARQTVVKPGDPDHLELPYARTMLCVLAFSEKPQRVLIIGLGGGSLPMFLRKHYPQAAIDVVDIDPDVVAVAKKYFGFREDATLKAHAADGRKFVEQAQKPYDIIFLDAFGSDSIPYHLATKEFLVAVRAKLAPGGVVVGNVWSRNANALYDSMVRTYQEVFDELYIFDVPQAWNQILIARTVKKQISREELAKQAARLTKEQRLRFNMGDLVHYGYFYMEEKEPRGKVLRDKDNPSNR
jgi:spermidine synthase